MNPALFHIALVHAAFGLGLILCGVIIGANLPSSWQDRLRGRKRGL